jgi:hypothetical protein
MMYKLNVLSTKYYFLFVLLLISVTSFAQNHRIDSLKLILRSAYNDSTSIQILKLLVETQNDAPVIIQYAKAGITLTRKVGRTKDELNFLMALSTGYFKNYNYPEYRF